MNTLFWACPLTKIGIDFPSYEKTIRVFLANACSYAERNLKELGYGIFNGNLRLNQYEESIYKMLIKKLKGISDLSMDNLDKEIDILRGIHNYGVHYYYDKKTKIDISNLDTRFLKLFDYDIANEEGEITFFGALVTICKFIDREQATCIKEDFKSMFLKYKPPVYKNIKDREVAIEKIGNVIKSFCNNTAPLYEKMDNESKNNGFDTNTICRRFIGELFYTIEKETNELEEDSYNFTKKINSLGINDDTVIEDLKDIRNWYCHGGYIMDEQNGKKMTPSFIIDTIYKIYGAINLDSIKITIKSVSRELLINCFDMMAKYSIKILDRRMIGDAFLLTKSGKIEHRVRGLDYHDPFKTGFYTIEDFEKLMSVCDNTYKSRYNDGLEFRNCKRNFTTSHLQFVTLHSKKNITIAGHDAGKKEFTLINPLEFDYNNEDEIHFVTVNGFNAIDIFTIKQTRAISRIDIDLDRFKSQPIQSNDYLFYDIKKKEDGIIFDYLIVDDKFKDIESNSLNYVENYQTIKKLLTRPNTLNMSYGIKIPFYIININEENNLDNFNYSFINIKDLYSFVRDMLDLDEEGHGLVPIAKKFGLSKKVDFKKTDYVVLMKLILEREIESSGIEFISDFIDEANAKYKVKGSSVFRNGILIEPLKTNK